MRILITGNLGYIGPVVVEHLRAARPDARLAGCDAAFFAHSLTNAQTLPEHRLEVQHFADVRSQDEPPLAGVDAIVHLAAISNDPMGNSFEAVTLDINHCATVALARRAKAAGVRAFVFASSCSVYGCAEAGARNEQSEVAPLTAYARSKVLAERDLRPLAGDGFQITCLRFATACGMSDRLRLDLVVNDFVASALANKRIDILSDGTPWRPLIHVRDMARAIDWAIGRGAEAGGDYLVINAGSNSWNHQVKTLAEAVARQIPGVEVSINHAAPPDKRSYQVSFDLFAALAPAHQPRYDLAATIEDLRRGLTEMQFKDQEFRRSPLIRLVALARLRERGWLDADLRWTRPTPQAHP